MTGRGQSRRQQYRFDHAGRIGDALPTWRGQNEQTMAHAAIAYTKTMRRRKAMAVTSSVGPGATNFVTVLADAAENVEEIDITRAQAAKKRAEDALANLKPEDHDAYLRMEAALRRSNLRLDAVRRYRRTRDTYTEQDASM